MRTLSRDIMTLALLPAAVLILASCESEPKEPAVERTSATTFEQGVPGGTTVDTYKMIATVSDVDREKREVTLTKADGEKIKVKCGPQVVNFDQIREGDRVTVTATEEVAVYMSTSPPADAQAASVVLAPRGEKPGGVVAETRQVTATVTAIDLKNHKATLRFPDGRTRTVAVRKDVDLTQRRVGEQVVIHVTDTVAIAVAKS